MATPEYTSDPLTEHDNLISDLADLEKKFTDQKIRKNDFESRSEELKERILRAELRAYTMARKNESLAKRLRLRNYSDPEVQQVINHFMRGSRKPLEPEFGADRLPRYPIEHESGERSSIERSLLQRMADIGIVTETLFERILYCPNCATPSNVYLRLKCTQCSSIDISIAKMIEHLQCGTIHQENAFRVGKDLICPTCKNLLQGTEEYRLIGVVCSCNACGARFEDPVESFFCRKCKYDFNLPSAVVVDVFSYGASKEALNEARRFLQVNALTKILGEAGFQVTSPGVLAGHAKEVVFSVLVQRDTRVIAVDVSQSDSEVEVEPVLELYVKMLEAKPTVAVFGAVPRLSQRARDVASSHNILVAEGVTPIELARKVLEIVERA